MGIFCLQSLTDLFDPTVVEVTDPQNVVHVITDFVVKHHGLVFLVSLESTYSKRLLSGIKSSTYKHDTCCQYH